MADLTTTVAGVRWRNPLWLASGIWGESGESLRGAYEAGAGAVITKSIGSGPRPGYPNPTVEPLGPVGMLNALGLPNPGIEEYPREIEKAVSAGVPVIGSIFGGSANEFTALARAMSRTGVRAIELNLSCPHAEGFGTEVGSDPHLVERIVRRVRAATTLPVIAKLTPNTSDPGALARAAERGGANAVSAINTVRGLAIEPELRRPVLAHGIGGLSGPAIKPVGLACVWQIYEAIDLPIVGIGGISTATDVVEYLLAGASAVEIGTAVAQDGIEVFGTVAKALSDWMDRHGVGELAELIGAAHPGRRAKRGSPRRTRSVASHRRRRVSVVRGRSPPAML